jgi:predicted nucleic acid-binding protein
MPQNPLVFDASALFNFGHRGNLSQLLVHLRESHTLIVTPSVVAEVVVEPRFEYTAFIEEHFGVQQSTTMPEDLARLALLSASLGAGELDVILLTMQTKGTAVIDERAARRHTRELGLAVIGTLGLLQYAVEQKWMSDPDVLASVQQLRRNGFRCPSAEGFTSLAKYLELFRE